MRQDASGISLALKEQVARDVARVRKDARATLEIGDGSNGEFKENLQGRLNIVAVIGRGTGLSGTKVAGQVFEEALLLEVGLWRTRPYRRVEVATNFSGSVNIISRRRKWFELDKEQYVRVVPEILFYLQYHVDRRVNDWKQEGVVWLSTPRNYYSRSQRTFFRSHAHKPQLQGVRCTISAADSLFFNDVCAAELTERNVLNHICGLARATSLHLQKHMKGFRDFRRLNAAHYIAVRFQNKSLTPHLKLEALRQLSRPLKAQFGAHLLELLKLEPADLTKRPLVRPKNFENIQLRIVQKNERNLVAEIFATVSKKIMAERSYNKAVS